MACSSLSSSVYSPLRPRTTGASTWNLVPSSSSSTRSTICCGVCRAIGRPQIGQCGLPDPGEQQPQVVVDLGDRADGRPRVAAGGLLVDGHRRGQAVDEVHVRLVHLAEELPGVRGQRLDVPPLALGEDRVERQARLARPGQPGEHDHGVARQVERDVLEVVLACAANDKPVSHCALFSRRLLLVLSLGVPSADGRSGRTAGRHHAPGMLTRGSDIPGGANRRPSKL